MLPKVLDGLQQFGADLVIYDQIIAHGPIAAYLLDIPCVAMITVSSLVV